MVNNSIRKNDFILNVRLSGATLYVGQYPLRKGPATKRTLDLKSCTEAELAAVKWAVENRPELFASSDLDAVVQAFRR